MNSRPKPEGRRRKPTPQQIRERCRKIQEEWTESTRRRRAGHVDIRWTVPETRTILSSVSGRLIEGRV